MTAAAQQLLALANDLQILVGKEGVIKKVEMPATITPAAFIVQKHEPIKVRVSEEKDNLEKTNKNLARTRIR